METSSSQLAVESEKTYKYLLFVPKSYNEQKETKFPLILFLHGAGETGSNLEKVKVHGIPKIVEKKPDFPFIAISPQCPFGERWESAKLRQLVQGVQNKYRVDEDRIYGTGLSMGGYGIWRMAMDYPDLFAALVPICGGGNPLTANKIKHLPLWAFHGEDDDIIPVQESKKMIDVLQKLGATEAKLTTYPNTAHDSWTVTYENEELYKWLLSHKRSSSEAK